MRLFISWSGEESKAIAALLRDWIPLVLQAVDPWMSSEDIAKGTQWTAELTKAIRESKFAVICVTPTNANEPWINFEAGALAFSYETGRVSPLLLGITPTELPPTLSQFRCTKNSKGDFKRLIQSINETQEKPVSLDRLTKGFELAWSDFESAIEGGHSDKPAVKRNPSSNV